MTRMCPFRVVPVARLPWALGRGSSDTPLDAVPPAIATNSKPYALTRPVCHAPTRMVPHAPRRVAIGAPTRHATDARGEGVGRIPQCVDPYSGWRTVSFFQLVPRVGTGSP